MTRLIEFFIEELEGEGMIGKYWEPNSRSFSRVYISRAANGEKIGYYHFADGRVSPKVSRRSGAISSCWRKAKELVEEWDRKAEAYRKSMEVKDSRTPSKKERMALANDCNPNIEGY